MIFLLGLVVVLFSCGHKEVVLPDVSGIYDLASPVRLNSDTTAVFMSDYFLFPEKVKKVQTSSGLKAEWSDDRQVLKLIRQGDVEPMENLRLTYEGYVYDIPLIGDSREADKAPEIYTGSLSGDTIWLQSRNPVKAWLVYLQNQRLGEHYFVRHGDKTGILIPKAATKVKRSEMRVWAINAYGVSNDIFIPLEYGRVILDASQLDRFDKRASVLYFLMVDRFYDSIPENNRPLNSKEVLPVADYMGGDLAGVTQKLKEGYFDSLGINTIWLSPITQNPEGAYGLWKNPRTKFSGYHGYWPVSSTRVDDRYGTSDELKELVEEAHKKNINVILDYVANHVHRLHPLYREHKDWATDLYLPDGTLNTERWDEYRLTTWFDSFLPTLDLQRPEVYEPMTDSALFWIKEYNLDGFRHDATKHIPEIFWRTLTRKLKRDIMFPKNMTIYQVGETYGSRELIASYVGSGQLDGQFDFNVYDDAVAAFARPDVGFRQLNASLEESFHYYGVHSLMSYISGNQDRARFISYAAGDLRFDEDSKAAGWKRRIGERKPSDVAAYDKLVQLLAFNATIPGIPVVFYGDEIGMTGGNDPDNRRMMRFDGLSEEEEMVKEKTARLNTFRRESMALMFGDFIPLRVEDDIYAYLRSYFGEDVIVIFNKGRENMTLRLDLPARDREGEFKSLFGGRFSYDNSQLIADVPANGVEIIYNTIH